MSKSDTPETEMSFPQVIDEEGEWVLKSLAERLERERDEARRVAEDYRDRLLWPNAKRSGQRHIDPLPWKKKGKIMGFWTEAKEDA